MPRNRKKPYAFSSTITTSVSRDPEVRAYAKKIDLIEEEIRNSIEVFESECSEFMHPGPAEIIHDLIGERNELSKALCMCMGTNDLRPTPQSYQMAYTISVSDSESKCITHYEDYDLCAEDD